MPDAPIDPLLEASESLRQPLQTQEGISRTVWTQMVPIAEAPEPEPIEANGWSEIGGHPRYHDAWKAWDAAGRPAEEQPYVASTDLPHRYRVPPLEVPSGARPEQLLHAAANALGAAWQTGVPPENLTLEYGTPSGVVVYERTKGGAWWWNPATGYITGVAPRLM